MTENPDLGTETPAPVADGKPSQPVQPEPKPIESDVTKLLTEFSGKLDDVSNELRGLQGRQQKLDNQTNDFKSQLARLKQYEAKGMSQEDAVSAMQNDDAQNQWRTTLEQKIDNLTAQFKGGGTPANDNSAVSRVFENIGLDLKDVRVASALLRKYDTPEQVRLAAYDLREEITKSPSPTTAQGASMQGESQGARNLNSLYAEYEQIFKNPTQNSERMKQLEQEIKAAGG